MTDPTRPALAGPSFSSRLVPLWLALILLAGLSLRLWQLDRHGLWWDEGNNAYFAHASTEDLLDMSRLTNDTNPPAHRLVLGLWLGVLGDSVTNMRLLSVLCGMATAVLAYLWGRRLGGVHAGLLAAALLSLAPMAVYYSREAKGYPWVMLWEWVALTLLAPALGIERGPRTRRVQCALWAGYVAASVLAVGAHYYALWMHLAQAVWLAAMLALAWPGGREALRRAGPWIAAQFAVLALIAPWTLLTWQTAFAGAQNVPMERSAWDLGMYLTMVLTTLAGGPYGPRGWAWVAFAVLALGATQALVSATRARRAPTLAAAASAAAFSTDGALYGLVAAVLVVPLAGGYLAQGITVFVVPRFFLYVLPALCILAGLGLAALRWRAVPLLLLLAAAWRFALPGAYTPVAPPEEDIRPLGATLRALAQPGDAVVVNYIWEEGMLRMYAPDAPVGWHLGWFTDETVAAELQAILSEHPRLWLVTYQQPLQHPSNQAGWWLEQHAARALAQEQGHTRLALYVPGCPGETTTYRTTFGDAVALTYVPPPSRAAPGDVLSLPLIWEPAGPLPGDLTVFLQLLGPDGALAAQADGDPINGLAPLSAAESGETLSECRALLVPADAPEGAYTVIVGLYDRATGARLPVSAGSGVGADHVVLGTVLIAP